MRSVGSGIFGGSEEPPFPRLRQLRAIAASGLNGSWLGFFRASFEMHSPLLLRISGTQPAALAICGADVVILEAIRASEYPTLCSW
jgi:hypothetical protein